MDDNPMLSQRTIERVLQKLHAEGTTEKVGTVWSTAYRETVREKPSDSRTIYQVKGSSRTP